MCMRNVNATITFCSNITENDGMVSLIGIYDSVVPTREDNIYYLDNFNAYLNCSILFGKNSDVPEDWLKLDTEYEFMIWMTHVESGLGICLYKFDLLVTQEDLKTWCRDFYEFKRFIKYSKLEIPKGLGNYAIKMFIREKHEKTDEETRWNNQTIHSLIIGESR